MISTKEFWAGHGGERKVKTHVKPKSHKLGRKQASTSKSVSSFFTSPKDNVQLKIVVIELTWTHVVKMH